MNVWILTHLANSPSTRLLLEAGRAMGHTCQRVNPRRLHFTPCGSPGDDVLMLDGTSVPLPDVVITRMGSSSPLGSLHVLRELENRGIRCFNKSSALEKSRDKVRTFQELVKRDLPVPKTVVLGADAPLEEVVPLLQGPPWILKLPVSTQGKGVMIVDSMLSLRSIADTITGLSGSLMLQEFVKESAGTDYRVLVLGGKAIAAMRRKAAIGEFRSNIHRGGSPESVPLSSAITAIAEEATAILGLDIAGVDLLESERGFQILEVNGSPGLEGLQSVTKQNLARAVFRHCITSQ